MDWYYYVLIAVGIILLVFILYQPIQILFVGLTQKERIQKNLTKECKLHDYLCLNDMYVKVNEEYVRKVDTIIFGNKLVYIVTELVVLGKLEGLIDDKTWLLYNGKEMNHVNNPFKENRVIIDRLIETTKLAKDSFVSIVALAKTINNVNIKLNDDAEFLCMEDEILSSIEYIESKSNRRAWGSKTQEAIANSFYEHSKYLEKQLKKKGVKN